MLLELFVLLVILALGYALFEVWHSVAFKNEYKRLRK